MHIAKYHSEAVAPILAHNYRTRESTLNRPNIDKEKSNSNLVFKKSNKKIDSEYISELKKIQKETTGRAVRKDAVVLMSIVVTKPPEVRSEDAQRFFKESCTYLTEKLEKSGLAVNRACITGTVHNDETTPHLHFTFAPVKEVDGKVSFSRRSIVDRQFYRTVHQDLSNHIEKKLGYKTSILLDKDKDLNSVLSRAKLDQNAFKQIKDKMQNEIKTEINNLEQKKDKLEQKKDKLESGNLELLDEKKDLKQRLSLCEEELNEKKTILTNLKLELENTELNYPAKKRKLEKLNTEQQLLNNVLNNLNITSDQELLGQRSLFVNWLNKS